MRLRGGGLPLVASLGPSARSLLGAVRRHWRLAPHHWSGAWRRWSNGDCRLEPHLDHCGQRTPAPPWKDRATGTRRRSGLYETPASLEQPCLPGRDRLPFPLVTADPVGQPLPSAVPTYGTTPPCRSGVCPDWVRVARSMQHCPCTREDVSCAGYPGRFALAVGLV